MTFGSLFSGCGGFDLGFDRAGLRCAFQVEIDRTASSVLARHWPDVPRFSDVRAVGRANLSAVDVLVGGFPCQDISVAGAREGLSGARSGLFHELARVCDELRPGVLVWENVAGLWSSDGGRDIRRVCSRLADLGYFGAVRTLDAEGFGVAQTRRRVFGAFARGRAGAGRGAEILALAAGVCRDTPAGGKAGSDVAATLGSGPPGRGWSDDFDRAGAFIPAVARTLRAAGHDASEDGAGRGTPLIAYAPDTAATLTAGTSRPGVSVPGRRREDDHNLVAFGGNDTRGPRRPAAGLNGRSTCRHDFETETFVVNSTNSLTKKQAQRTDRARSLDTTGGQISGQGGTVVVGVIPIDMRQASRGETMTNNRKLGSSGGAPGTGIGEEGDPCPTLAASHTPAVFDGVGVRRMTPRECERVMGWPDDFTRWRADGSEIADGPRYRMIGNGVVATVAEWIGRRLLAAEEST